MNPVRAHLRRFVTLCAFLLAFAVATPAMAAQFTLKVGKTTVSTQGYEFTNARPVTAAGTRRRGAVKMSALHVYKALDNLSARLLHDNAGGKTHPVVVLTVSEGGKKIFQITLKNASILSVTHETKNKKVSEDVAFNYEEVTWTFFDAAGKKIKRSWNVAEGVR